MGGVTDRYKLTAQGIRATRDRDLAVASRAMDGAAVRRGQLRRQLRAREVVDLGDG